ncbi:MAG TPA: hypothetical protein VF041_00465 [Gemmatimonadaceae bacterium]
MADFTKRTIADMAADHPDIDLGTTGSMHEVDWPVEEEYWRGAFSSRPYTLADRGFGFYRPAYRYGAESAARHHGREWHQVEPELERGWEAARGESRSTWQEVKDAVRDAWDHVRGHD